MDISEGLKRIEKSTLDMLHNNANEKQEKLSNNVAFTYDPSLVNTPETSEHTELLAIKEEPLDYFANDSNVFNYDAQGLSENEDDKSWFENWNIDQQPVIGSIKLVPEQLDNESTAAPWMTGTAPGNEQDNEPQPIQLFKSSRGALELNKITQDPDDITIKAEPDSYKDDCEYNADDKLINNLDPVNITNSRSMRKRVRCFHCFKAFPLKSLPKHMEQCISQKCDNDDEDSKAPRKKKTTVKRVKTSPNVTDIYKSIESMMETDNHNNDNSVWNDAGIFTCTKCFIVTMSDKKEMEHHMRYCEASFQPTGILDACMVSPTPVEMYNPRILQCKQCDAKFSDVSNFKKHIKSECVASEPSMRGKRGKYNIKKTNDSKSKPCPNCGKEYPAIIWSGHVQQCELMQQAKDITSKTNMEFQGNSSTPKVVLSSYIKKTNPDSTRGQIFKCKQCSEEFPRFGLLNRHEQQCILSKEQEHKIGNVINKNGELMVYVNKHADPSNNKYICSKCGAKFAFNNTYLKHIHSCKFVNKCVNPLIPNDDLSHHIPGLKWNLMDQRVNATASVRGKQHVPVGEFTHATSMDNEVKPVLFSCSICSAKFAHKVTLQTHERACELKFDSNNSHQIANKASPKCEHCYTYFTSERQLEGHQKVCPYRCRNCEMIFLDPWLFSNHVQWCKTVCKECGQKYSDTKIHMKTCTPKDIVHSQIITANNATGTYPCFKCGKILLSCKSYDRHFRVCFAFTPKEDLRCNVCYLGFDNIDQLKLHVDHCPLECVKCQQKMIDPQLYRVHVKNCGKS